MSFLGLLWLDVLTRDATLPGKHLRVNETDGDRARRQGYTLAGGFASDASAVALIEPSRNGYTVVYVEERFNCAYDAMIERICDLADTRRGSGYHFSTVYSETNGCGMAPTQSLQKQLGARGIPAQVEPVATTAKTKENQFGALKMAMQQGRLKLPSHPSLLRQLAALEFETTETGTVKISVPERAGHDDFAMALALAATGISSPARPWASSRA